MSVKPTTAKEQVTSLRAFAYRSKSAQSKLLRSSLHSGPSHDTNHPRDVVTSPHADPGEANET